MPDFGIFSIVASRVLVNHPGDTELLGDVRGCLYRLLSFGIHNDGSNNFEALQSFDPGIGDALDMNNNNIINVNQITFSDGTVLPSASEENMIIPVFLGGETTSSGSGIINDTNQDFTTNVGTNHLVSFPGLFNELLFQISNVAVTALTLKTSSAHVTGADVTIPANASYRIHSAPTNVELRRIVAVDTLTAGASGTDTTVAAILTDARMIKLEINNIAASGTAEITLVEFTYGDNSVLQEIGDGADEKIVVLFRTKPDVSTDLTVKITVGAGTGNASCDVYVFESVDVANTTKALIDETEANS